MAAAAVVALALLLFEDHDLTSTLVFEDGCFNHGTLNERSSQLKANAFTKSEYFANLDLRSGFSFGIAI